MKEQAGKTNNAGNPANSLSAALGTEGGKTSSVALEIPSIALPKGGGAIKSIDEKFSVNALNGTASFGLALPFSPARGASPSLGLSYNSGNGNGIFGIGWALDLPCIKRKTDKCLPRYQDANDSDTFLFSGAEDLVPAFSKSTDGKFLTDDKGDYIIMQSDSPDGNAFIRYYLPRTEGLFARIERWQLKTTGEISWKLTTRDNQTTLFGWTISSRIADPADNNRIYAWLPEFVFDDKGNCSRYIYQPEDDKGLDQSFLHNRNRLSGEKITYTNTYLQKILYGNKTPYLRMGDPIPDEGDFLFSTVFDYGTYDQVAPFELKNDWSFRSDPFSDYRAGFEIRTTRRCSRVILFHHFKEEEYDGPVRSLSFDYDSDSVEGLSFLRTITATGYAKQPDGTYTQKSLPEFSFTYQLCEWSSEIKTISTQSLINVPAGIDGSNYQFTDLFSEGLSGILTEQTGNWYYKDNLGEGSFAEARLISPKPTPTGLSSLWQLTDLDADGGRQLVNLNTEPRGFFELKDENEWAPFKPFPALPNLNLHDPHIRMLDLDGDGRPEILYATENTLYWYRSEGREGFAPMQQTNLPTNEEKGPCLVYTNEIQTVFLSDMCGDGLTDIVRIRNGEICYWPNLGYGRFGNKITMDNSPLFDHPDSFQPSCIKLADIDGSGTTDILYLGKNLLQCWLNAGGNRFSKDAFEITAFPAIHGHARVTVTDILGNGLPCICWSSDLPADSGAPVKYMDLMNGNKPYILSGYKNNLGKEVSFGYTPSTKFYLDDKLAGQPWATKLHFPVHCVSSVETIERIDGSRFVSSYTYHHGYYDHAEREFRGFGMVEQSDTEYFDNWIKGDASNIVDATLHQEPIVTKTWFHTGAFLEREKILSQFADQYWYAVMQEQGYSVTHHESTLPDAELIIATDLDPALMDTIGATEWQQALRACKGMSLRSEVFAKDAASFENTEEAKKQEMIPYSVATHNCRIELLQPKGRNPYAVFIVRESQAISYQYERDSEDPRISHTLSISQDMYGNLVESATVVYPRLTADTSLPEETQQVQASAIVIYTQNNYTGDLINTDTYRLRVLSETKTFELKGVIQSGTLYIPSDFENILSPAKSTAVAYHEWDITPETGITRQRLVEHIRTIYYDDELTTPLPLNVLGACGLVYQTYQLAYTPELIADIYDSKASADIMLEGKFIHSEGDSNWWIPSGTICYNNSGDILTDRQTRFFSPLSYRDAYGATTTLSYYGNYYLLIESALDAFGNSVSTESFDFRTLSPQRIVDSNGNISACVSDELGLVKAMAVFGKGDEADNLDGIESFTTTTETEQVDQFFSQTETTLLIVSANELLCKTTARFIYDFDAYRISGKPVCSATIMREEHYHNNPDSQIQIGIQYFNGRGKVIMKKVQAEPGQAKKMTLAADGTYTIEDVDTSALSPTCLRWIGNGRTILNNKGMAVMQYEPYFSVSPSFENAKELVETGVSPVMYYDSLGRCVKTEHPDGTCSATVFDSWKYTIYDANDNCLESSWYKNRINRLTDDLLREEGRDPELEEEAANKTSPHAGTPAVLYFDCLGRPVLSVEHNRDIDTNVNIYQQTITRLDSEGNLRSVTDANGNTVMQYRYDMLGKLVWQSGMDNGQRWLLTDIMGAPLRTWDERGHTFCYYYDILHRPTCQKVQGGDGASPLDHIFDRVFYGEDLLEAERSNEAALKALNLLGKPVKQYDTAGLTSIPSYDFNGQPISTSRRLFSKYREVADWTDANLDSDLETDSYTFITQTDALGRINLQTAPDNSIIRPSYNQRGLFNGESVLYHGQTDAVTYIRGITYNEKGLRSSIDYGNEVTSSFTYDRQTFRLIRLQTIKKNGDTLQDWNYTYDPVGNIVFLEDRNIPEVFFDNHKTTGRAEYTYDAVYRLIKATGRENNVSLAFGAQDNYDDSSFAGVFHNSDPMTMRGYIQNYRYDSAGNITGMQHLSSGNNWKRDYTYETGNNRLQQTQVNDNVYTYTHHPAQGFITAMPHLSDIGWNFKEEMVRSASQRRTDGGTPETTYYQYDSNGKRIRKVTDNTAAEGEIPTRKNERIYIAGYETCRDYTGGSVSLEMESLSLIDQGNRFVMIETITHNILPSNDGSDSVGVRLTRYQFNNHQGSSSLELDDRAEVISYEEYHPFGTTSFQAKNAEIRAASKRYRYTSMERDGETGLEYHTARYYIPWLGRWVSTDPIGIRDGANLYQYAKNNPLRLADTKGTQAEQQMGFWECKAYWTDVTATYSSRGISADLRATYTGLYRMWTSDYSTKIDVGHMEKPFVFLQSGEVSKVGPQDASGNRSDGGGAVRAMSQAVKATGGFAREDGLDTSPAGLASKGLRNAPNPLPASLQDPRLIPMGKMPPPSTSPQVTSPAPSTVTTTASGSQQLHFSFVEDESPQLSFNFNKPAPSPAPATGPAQEQLQFDFTKPAAPAAPAPKPAAPAAPKSSPTSSGSSQESGTSLAPGGGAGAGTLGAVGRNVPFVAEAESVLISGSYAAAPYSAAASTYLMATAEALPVAAGVGVVGVGAGHAARYTATQLGASEATANSIGLGAAIVTGAAIGSVIPGVGTAVGAGIGAVVAGGMYLWSL